MAHYEPDKIIQLLQLCCWRERKEMNPKGLMDLSVKLGPVLQSEDGKRSVKAQEPNERYFVDLLSNARKKQNDGSVVSQRESYVDLMLKHVGFNHWDDWKETLRKPGNFLTPEEASAEFTGEKALTIIFPQTLGNKLNPTLSFAGKSYQFNLLTSSENTLSDLAKHAMTELEKSEMIICAIPVEWKDQVANMRQPAWGDFSGTGRILPVWIDINNEWNPVAPFLPAAKKDQSTGGIAGLLTGLFFLENYGKTQAADNSKAAGRQSRENVPQFINSNVGFYMQGGTIHHLNTSGDQTINNYFD